jgi:hypothetical protein
MSVTWGLDPKSKRISVYFAGETTIYEGMPVCYDNSTTNWMGVDGSGIDFTTTASSITEQTTTDDGYQNEGKFIRVELPNADNCGMFAGVVAGADHAGETGPKALDIYVPNGAVVPVRTDQNCLLDQTVLAIQSGEEELGVPISTDGRPVAIARETIDRGTAGLVLAELCPERFLYQDMGGTALSIDDASTGTDCVVNRINVDFLQATGNCTALWVQATSGAGAASNGYGLAAYFEADISAAVSAHTAGVGIWTNITGGTQTKNICALEVGIYEADAHLTGATYTVPLVVRTQIDSTNPPTRHYMTYYVANGADKPDGLFMSYTADSIGMTTASDTTCTYNIPIYIQVSGGGVNSGVYYIMAKSAA